MKILNAYGRNLVIVDDVNFGKTMVKIANNLDYLNQSHIEDEEEIVGVYNQIKQYGIKESGFGTPYKFSDAKQSVVYIQEGRNNVVIDLTKLIKLNPEFPDRFEGKNKVISK